MSEQIERIAREAADKAVVNGLGFVAKDLLFEFAKSAMHTALEAREFDNVMLDWVIKQGPPGAADGIGFNDEAWEIAAGFASDECRTDRETMRAAICAAMKGDDERSSV